MKFLTTPKNTGIRRLLFLILLFGIGIGASRAASLYCQQGIAAKAAAGSSALSVSSPSPPTAGDVLLVGFDYTGTSVASVSDSLGGAYYQVGTELASPGGARSRVY